MKMENFMSLSSADAAAALQEAAGMEQRSSRLRGYQSASPHAIIWGVIWAIGYMGNYLAPAWSNAIWIGLVVLGTVGSIVAGVADGRHAVRAEGMIELYIIYAVFVGGTLAVMAPHDVRQVAAFFPLVTAAAYGVIGAFGARRMLVIAGAIAALTLGGFFTIGDLYLPWMAVVGGGGLVLGGLWLRLV
jgi:hypothetical protein